MKVFEDARYVEDLRYVGSIDLPWEKMENRTVLASGATGLVGSFLIDVLMQKNIDTGLNCTIYALGRNVEKAKERFSYCWNSGNFRFIPYDVNMPLILNDVGNVDFILHMASNTHPMQYSTDPIGTITTNIIGTQNMLEFAAAHNAVRCAFTSSNEIYGENRGDVERFDEAYCGYLDSNTLRAGYPESKRCGEALCQAYIRQKGLDIVIPRLTRSYGPTLLGSDTKALSQFLHRALEGNDIILKSAGTQYYSYLHVADTVSGIFTILLKGEKGEAYNVADEASDITLRDLAEMIARHAGTKVVFEIPSAVESAGYSRATKARLDSKKLKTLGWNAKYTIQSGIEQTLDILLTIR